MKTKSSKNMFSFIFLKSAHGRLAVITCTLLYVIIFLLWQAHHSPSHDPLPHIYTLDKTALNKASQVEVGMHINNFPEASFKDGQFTVDAIVWFKFQVGTETLDTISKFTLYNSFEMTSGAMIYLSAPIIKLIDNFVIVSYHMQSRFNAQFNYKNFPMSDQRLAIIIQNKQMTPYELSFVTNNDNFSINQQELFTSWNPIKLETYSGYFKSALKKNEPAMEISYPVAVFTIDFENIGFRSFASLYLPLLLLFFIVLLCLLLDVSDSNRLVYMATAVPILVLYRLAIDAVSPNVGYNTHIDYMFYTLIMLSILVLLFQTYVSLELDVFKTASEKVQHAENKRLDYRNDVFLIIVLLILIIATMYGYFR